MQNAHHNAVFLVKPCPHEIATFCGYDVIGAQNGMDTNWCKHSDRPLEELLTLEIDNEDYMCKRMSEIFRKTAKYSKEGYFLFHSTRTKLDLLLSIRGDENLCMDTYTMTALKSFTRATKTRVSSYNKCGMRSGYKEKVPKTDIPRYVL